MDLIDDLGNGAWNAISHLFDGIPSGEPLIWSVTMVVVIVSIAWSEATRR